MKRLLALVLAVVMIVAACSGCGGGGSESTAEKTSGQSTASASDSLASKLVSMDDVAPDESRKSTANSSEKLDFLQVALSAKYAPDELGPEYYEDTGKHQVLTGVYEQLVEKITIDEYEPLLAKEYHWEDDLTLVLEIYDYIYDSDGNHFTASDILFSYDTIIEAGRLGSSSFFEGVEKVDDYTVKFTFTKELDLNAFDDIVVKQWMFTEKAYKDHDMATDPVGTGPYTVVSYDTGASAVIEARDDYWQKEELVDGLSRSTVQKMQIDFLSDKSMLLIALEEGSSAYADLDKDSVTMFIDDGEYADEFNVYNYTHEKQGFDLAPNISEASLCNDINLRLAIFYAVDTTGFCEALGSQIFSGCTVNAPRTCSDYQESWDSWENYMTTCDLSLAKEYLEKSNYNGETLVITGESNENKKTIALALQGMLTELGVNTELNMVDRSILSNTLSDETAWDIYIYTDKSDYACSRLYQMYSEEYGYVDGYPVNFCKDEKLQTMLSECNMKNGYSIEKTEEIMKYIIENAYDYTICYEAVKPAAFDKRLCSIETKWDMGNVKIILTACDYYLD